MPICKAPKPRMFSGCMGTQAFKWEKAIKFEEVKNYRFEAKSQDVR